jgi:ferredoxin-NADP reductase
MPLKLGFPAIERQTASIADSFVKQKNVVGPLIFDIPTFPDPESDLRRMKLAAMRELACREMESKMGTWRLQDSTVLLEKSKKRVAFDQPVAWTGVRQFKVSCIRRVSNACAEVTFTPAEDSCSPIDFAPGQVLAMNVLGGDATPRHFFLTNSPGESYLKCCMKLESGLRLNTVVELAAPHGPCRTGGRPVVLVSGGLGVAPMKSFLESAPEKVRFVIHIDESDASHAFRKEFRRSRVDHLFHYTSKSRAPSSRSLVKLVTRYLPECDVVLAGPGDFLESMQHALNVAGAKRVHALALGAES